ncbi:MAG: CoA-binding protein [Comamonadaceae bacterium]|nr:CoA-binding protein [Comamonadaceae bacterium]
MDILTLDNIFKPQRIALVGISPNPKSVSARILANLVGGGFRGVVYPVSPSTEAVMGIPCFPSVGLPAQDARPRHPVRRRRPGARARPGMRRGRHPRPDRRLGRLPGDRPGRPGPRGAPSWRKPGASRGCGSSDPTASALISPGRPLNASFAGAMPRPGHVAFVSQSGALCTSVLDWAAEEKLGFSHFVSTGNMLDVDFGDLIDYLGEDEETKSIILYIESIQDARKFMTAARAFARMKPIVAYKAGRFAESAAAAASHTGRPGRRGRRLRRGLPSAWAWPGSSTSARSSTAPISSAAHKVPEGPRLAVLTNAGGPGRDGHRRPRRGGRVAGPARPRRPSAELDAEPAASLVPPQSRGRPRRRQVEARGQGGPDRAPGSRRRRPARHRHPAGHDQSDGHRQGGLRPGRRHAQARPGRLARRRGHARGHEPPQRGRRPHLSRRPSRPSRPS